MFSLGQNVFSSKNAPEVEGFTVKLNELFDLDAILNDVYSRQKQISGAVLIRVETEGNEEFEPSVEYSNIENIVCPNGVTQILEPQKKPWLV